MANAMHLHICMFPLCATQQQTVYLTSVCRRNVSGFKTVTNVVSYRFSVGCSEGSHVHERGPSSFPQALSIMSTHKLIPTVLNHNSSCWDGVLTTSYRKQITFSETPRISLPAWRRRCLVTSEHTTTVGSRSAFPKESRYFILFFLQWTGVRENIDTRVSILKIQRLILN